MSTRKHGRLYVARRTAGSTLKRLERLAPARSAPERIDEATLVRGLDADAVREVFPAEHVRLEPPREAERRFSRIPGWYPSERWRLDHELPAERAFRLRGGFVFGHEGWTGPDRSRVVVDWNAYARSDRDVAAECHGAMARGTVELPGTTASLLHLGPGNYFHWMLQGLPRLFALVEAFGADGIDRFVVGQSRAFIDESFRQLGISPDRVELVGSMIPALACETLVTAAMPQVFAPSPQWVIDRVRATFPPTPGTGGAQRVYIGRGDATRRRVVNEAEVLALLQRHGFRSVSMDGLTVADQAAVIAGAEMIVGSHGAALTNLVFARPRTRVIELLPANDPKPLFWHLAERVGADYDVLFGSEPALRGRHDVWMNDADMVVDTVELERLVRR